MTNIETDDVGDAQVLDIASDATIGRVAAIVKRVATQHDLKTEITETDSLVDKGLTSMAMVDLMLAMEAEFDVMIPQREMTPANFRTIRSLATLVDKLSFASR